MHDSAQKIKDLALELGFSACGIAAADYLDQDHSRLRDWLSKGYNAGMAWMENHEGKRVDPRKLVPGARSVVSVLYNYYQPVDRDPAGPKISMYAQGTDYHFIMKSKLKTFLQRINDEIAPTNGRVFVDSAPVLDRAWAAKSGLGWIGKNSMLINKNKGSYFFIGELIIDLALPADKPVTDHCGTCTACIDACPTDAIVADKVIDSGKCISYLTIENREDKIPDAFRDKMENWAFGCDICQEVCPWNRFSTETEELEFKPEIKPDLGVREWLTMTDEAFRTRFKRSPIKRAGLEGMKRNINFIKSEEYG